MRARRDLGGPRSSSVLLCGWLLLAGCDAAVTRGDGGQPPDGGPAACAVVAPTACPAQGGPRYPDVQPTLQRRCVICHSGQTGLWPLTTYQQVTDWYDAVRDDVAGCSMPPPDAGVPMTDEERLLILTWIRCGFPP